MKLSTKCPSIYSKLHEKFKVEWEKGLLITIGDTVYCNDPNIFNSRPDLAVHEKIHELQQRAMGSDEWWNKYLEDDAFRFKEELAAYQGQAYDIKQRITDRNRLFPFINSLAKDFAEMYALKLTQTEAYKLLK
jgi:hypothetical protein